MLPLIRFAELKLARARDQVRALEAAVGNWSASNPLVASCELRDGRLGFSIVQQAFAQPPPLDLWGVLAGEFIHNLRTSLDNLAFALARLRCDPPEEPHRIAFPIYTDRALFERSGRGNIDQLLPEAASLVERLQPFQRNSSPELGTPDRDALVHLQWLSLKFHRHASEFFLVRRALGVSSGLRVLSTGGSAR